MKRTITTLCFGFLSVASVALGAAPRLMLQVVSSDGVNAAGASRDVAVARLLGRVISPEPALVAAPIPSLAKATSSCKNERGASYHQCVFFGSALRTAGRLVVADIPSNVDALVVVVFSPSPAAYLYDGLYYLLTPAGVWRSSSFRVGRLPDGRFFLHTLLAVDAAQSGLDVVPGEPIGVHLAPNSTTYVNAIFDVPMDFQ